MMKKIKALALIGALSLTALSPAWASTDLPKTASVASQQLSKIGDGTRKKFFLKLYNAAYYGSDTQYKSDKPMLIRLKIISSLIDSAKLSEATEEGFNKVTGNNTVAINSEIQQLLEALSAPIKKGDILDFSYSNHSTLISKNGKPLTSIKGKAFKDTLFGIWLGTNGIDSGLRKDMLSQ